MFRVSGTRLFITRPMVRCLIVTDTRGVPAVAPVAGVGVFFPADSPQSLIDCSVNTEKGCSVAPANENRVPKSRRKNRERENRLFGPPELIIYRLQKGMGRHTTSVLQRMGEDVSNSLLSAGVQRASNNMML